MEGLFNYVCSPDFLNGAVSTLKLTICAQIAGVLCGFLLAIFRMSKFKIFQGIASIYIWIFRGIPVLVQLIFVYNALPQFGLKLTSFQSAMVALTLNEAAYMAEIIRSGLKSVHPGQQRAGYVLGMSKLQIMRHITLPQALRTVVPPTTNQFIAMLKTSSLASVVGYGDLLLTAQQMASASFDYIHTLIAAVVYYLFFTSIFTIAQIKIEHHLDISRRFDQAKSPSLFSSFLRQCSIVILGGVHTYEGINRSTRCK